MVETIPYRGVNIEIFEILVGINRRLDFNIIDTKGKNIPFTREFAVVNYSTNKKNLLIEDAYREIDRLIQNGQIPSISTENY